ncbi:MAG: PD-(D/E)XK nuclease family protein [Anaerolinea sp.]|nr:PD-(D/E)XK nuclease family protein [Anaerolinea sp.]MCC6972399.1 PD-(D/E)XK nuclease family protein [Anaerolineae bacterium]
MITLPPAFAFSQSSLQDFVECPRRFQLRHVMDQAWPAPAAEPLQSAEEAAEQGRRFHLLMERYWSGAPLPPIDPLLSRWWETFEQSPPPALPEGVRRPEVSLTTRLLDQRFTATFDLLAYDPQGEAAIVDWKTSRARPRHILDRRLQTVVYPLMLVEASPGLLGRQLEPEQVRLIYWFAEGGTVEIFRYSLARYEDDKRYLASILHQLMTLEVGTFPLTANERLCGLCQYRSLCGRGIKAGIIGEDEEAFPDVEELRGVLSQAGEEYVL